MNLASAVIPSSITSIGNSAFYQCTALTELTIPSSVTSIGESAFGNCTNLLNLTILSAITIDANRLSNAGRWSGGSTLYVRGNISRAANNRIQFNKIYIDGNYSNTAASYVWTTNPNFKVFRLKGNYSVTGSAVGLCYTYTNGASQFAFCEVLGDVVGLLVTTYGSNAVANGIIFHFGKDGLITGTPDQVFTTSTNTRGRIGKIYVGDGSSEAHDNAILALYTADANWSAMSSKLDTWYNYINSPDANPDYVNSPFTT